MPRGAPLTHVSKRVPDELLVGFNQSFCIPFSHDSRESSEVTIPRFQLVNRSRRSKSQFPNLRQSSIMKSKRKRLSASSTYSTKKLGAVREPQWLAPHARCFLPSPY